MKRPLLLAAALLMAACGTGGGGGPATTPPASASGQGPEIRPILVSSEITQGRNRFLFSLTDRQNKLIAAPDVAVHLLFYDVSADPNAVVFETDATFMWAIENDRGLYRADVTFPKPGRWGTRFEATFPDGSEKTVRADYDVAEKGTSPVLGAKAPSVDTPTAADVGGDLKRVSTDDDPDPRFYETSIADALAAREPFVVAFATPAFCETQLCGPTLETVKDVADDHPDLTFINVEPYVMEFRDGALQPVLGAEGHPQVAPWTEAWGLPSEPYVFVVGGDGTVEAKFEGTLAADELRAAIRAL